MREQNAIIKSYTTCSGMNTRCAVTSRTGDAQIVVFMRKN